MRKNKKGKGKTFKEIAEVLSKMGELNPYDGMKEDSVASKFNELLAQHAKKAIQASSKSGCDDGEFGELEKLLQDALDLQNGVHKIRSDFNKHEIDEDEKDTVDDVTILAAAGSCRASPLMRGRCVAAKRRRSGSSLVASTTSGLPTDEALAAYLLSQAKTTDDAENKKRRMSLQEQRFQRDRDRFETDHTD
jgi:hypothetical protein